MRGIVESSAGGCREPERETVGEPRRLTVDPSWSLLSLAKVKPAPSCCCCEMKWWWWRLRHLAGNSEEGSQRQKEEERKLAGRTRESPGVVESSAGGKYSPSVSCAAPSTDATDAVVLRRCVYGRAEKRVKGAVQGLLQRRRDNRQPQTSITTSSWPPSVNPVLVCVALAH